MWSQGDDQPLAGSLELERDGALLSARGVCTLRLPYGELSAVSIAMLGPRGDGVACCDSGQAFFVPNGAAFTWTRTLIRDSAAGAAP